MCKQTPQLSLPLHSCPRLRHRPVHTGGEVHSLSGKDDLGTRPWIQGIPGPQVSAAWSKREARDLSGCIPSAVRISCGEQWGWSRARGASEVGHLTSSCLGQRAIVLTLSAVSFPPFQHLFEEMAIKEQRKSLPLPGRLSLRFQEKWEPICGQQGRSTLPAPACPRECSCLCTSVSASVSVSVCLCVCIHKCTSVCVCSSLCVFPPVSIHIGLYVSVCVPLHVLVSVFVCVGPTPTFSLLSLCNDYL